MKINIVIDLEMWHVYQRRRDYPHRNETIQIGAVMLNESWEPMGRFSTYVCPRYGRIDIFIAGLTGITERDVRHAPAIDQALQSLLLWIGGRDACFYSWSDSDYYQLRNEIVDKGLGLDIFGLFLDRDRWVDYQKTVGARFGNGRSLSLADALMMTELEPEGQQHDGLWDAVNTARMISKLEMNPTYVAPIEKLRRKQQNPEPLTMSLGSLLQGIVLESA